MFLVKVLRFEKSCSKREGMALEWVMNFEKARLELLTFTSLKRKVVFKPLDYVAWRFPSCACILKREVFGTHFGTHIGFGPCVRVFCPFEAFLRAHFYRISWGLVTSFFFTIVMYIVLPCIEFLFRMRIIFFKIISYKLTTHWPFSSSLFLKFSIR